MLLTVFLKTETVDLLLTILQSIMLQICVWLWSKLSLLLHSTVSQECSFENTDYAKIKLHKP